MFKNTVIMNYDYHSVFVSAPSFKTKGGLKNYTHEIDGVEFTRDVQKTINEMSENGYQLFQNIPLISTKYHGKTYTEGVTLLFRKEINNEIWTEEI